MKRSGPAPLSDQVSRNMSRVKRRDTKPEVELRRELHRRGLRFQVDYGGVPRHPDVAFARAKIAVFIDGCFWHGCDIHGAIPKSDAEWWLVKRSLNMRK